MAQGYWLINSNRSEVRRFIKNTNNKLNNKIVITNFSGHSNIEKKINGKTILFDLSKIPRTTIAQSMDILSSMSGLSGYK